MRLHFNKKGLSSASFSKGNLTYNTKGRVSYRISGKYQPKYKHNNQSASIIPDLLDKNQQRMYRSREFISNCSKAYIVMRTLVGFLGFPIGLIFALMTNAETPLIGIILGGFITWWGISILFKMNDAKILNKLEEEKNLRN